MNMNEKVPTREIVLKDGTSVNGYDKEDAVNEANRCLGCPGAACDSVCPKEMTVSLFIGKLCEGKVEDAFNVMQSAGVDKFNCIEACPEGAPCEEVCIRSKRGGGINVAMLEQFVIREMAEQ